jgi:hypothetical protein
MCNNELDMNKAEHEEVTHKMTSSKKMNKNKKTAKQCGLQDNDAKKPTATQNIAQADIKNCINKSQKQAT